MSAMDTCGYESRAKSQLVVNRLIKNQTKCEERNQTNCEERRDYFSPFFKKWKHQNIFESLKEKESD